MKILSKCCFVVLMLAVNRIGGAGTMADGLIAYERDDYRTAYQVFKPLAEQGHAQAQHYLAQMYAGGLGVPEDAVKAHNWFLEAAQQGEPESQINIGLAYSVGQNVPRDDVEATRWFRRAAEQGNALAQGTLGVAYSEGQGVPQDYVEAHKWLNLASAADTPSTRGFFAGMRNAVAEKMTASQIAEAQELAREWRPVKER